MEFNFRQELIKEGGDLHLDYFFCQSLIWEFSIMKKSSRNFLTDNFSSASISLKITKYELDIHQH